eukprot:s305_g9.t4
MAEGQISTSAAWCAFYGAGIIGTLVLVLYGILQEGIMTVAYDGNLFQYSVFLVLCNRLAAVIFAVGMTAAKGESMQNAAPLWKYLIVSLSNVYASSCQYEALKYVSFAVQMLGKSFKMMPVMIWGIIIAGKAYSGRDWLVALTVTLGCTEFLMTGPTHSKVDATNSLKGFLLLGCFLALDGLTSTFQEKLFKEHKTTKYNQMLYINLLSATVSFITLLATGQLAPAVAFGFAHPQFWLDSALLSGSAVASQFFIYSQIKEFGALVFAATMNVRQVVSILVSYLKYHNPVTPLQILGLALIFSALFYKSVAAMLEAPSKEEKKPILADAKAEEAIETSKDKDDAGKVVLRVLETVAAVKDSDTEASAELLGEEEELRSSYKGTNVQTIWLEDLRTAEEKGEKEDTIIDQLQQLWKLDNVTVLSVLLVVYTFIKELLPLFIEGVKNPLQDLPWQPGPIDQFPPSAF